MKMRALANTGIELSCVGLGEMPLSLSTRPNEAQAISVVHAAVDAGMTWIDTADVYCAGHRDIGHGERLVTTALKAMGDSGKDIVVATKGGLERPGGNWTVNGHPDHLHSACAASLRALRRIASPGISCTLPTRRSTLPKVWALWHGCRRRGKFSTWGFPMWGWRKFRRPGKL